MNEVIPQSIPITYFTVVIFKKRHFPLWYSCVCVDETEEYDTVYKRHAFR
jgi:hypothetical protein